MSQEAKMPKLEEKNPEDAIEYGNGLILNHKHLANEVLLHIFRHIDYKQLLDCQLVCKHWRDLIRSETVREKAEVVLGRKMKFDETTPWQEYYLICAGKPFRRNIITNHSGEFGSAHWKWDNYARTTVSSDRLFERHYYSVNRFLLHYLNQSPSWEEERPPVGVPELPDDPVFDYQFGKNCCFAAVRTPSVEKSQKIDLVEAGIFEHILDEKPPIIQVSVWYSRPRDPVKLYCQKIQLLDKNDVVLKTYEQSYEISEKNKWFKVNSEIKNYGPGVRTIEFIHWGQNLPKAPTIHDGIKVAGICITLKLPEFYEEKEANVEKSPTKL